MRNGDLASTIAFAIEISANPPECIEGHENRVHNFPRSVVVGWIFIAIVGREFFDFATVGVQGALRQVSRQR